MTALDRVRSALSFRRGPAPLVVAEDSARVGLFTDTAVTDLVTMLSRMPDVDDVLRRAGIRRHNLRVLLTDDEIAQATDTRLDALLATPLRLEIAADRNGGDEAFAAFLLVEMTRHAEHIIAGAWSSLLLGYSVLEAVYAEPVVGSADPLDAYVRLAAINEKPMEWFEPRADGRLIYRPAAGVFGGAANPLMQPTENADGFYVDQTVKFFCTRRKATYDQPYGEALLSRLYWPWFFRQNGWRFWGKFLERFGAPMLVGNTSGKNEDMLRALLTAHSQAAMAIGKDDKVTAIETSGQGAAFDTFETACIRRIQKLILGSTLTSGTDGGSGNRALGQVHDNVRADKKISDIRLVGTTLQRVVDALCLLNGQHAGTYTVWLADKAGLSADRAARDLILYQQGVRWTPDYLVNNYELRTEDFTQTVAPEIPGTAPFGGTVPDPADPEAARMARRFVRHTTASRFTRNQQAIEELVDDAETRRLQPLEADAIRAAIVAASDPDDLERRLFALVGADPEFPELLERCLFAADVIGYVHATGAG